MSDKKRTNISYSAILGIAFIILKLCKVINWRWIWVLCPFWIPILLIILGVVLALVSELNKKDWITEKALKHKSEWQAGIPEENRNLSFCSNKKWHNGRYENGKFRVIGTNEFLYAEAWYYV